MDVSPPRATGLVALVPTAFTFSSLLSASGALVLLVLAPQTTLRDAAVAACIAWSMVADGLDGPLARKLHAESSLGAHLDSLADLTAFGVAPALWLISRHGLAFGAPAVLLGMAWIGAAAFRLARFADDGVKPGRFGPAFRGVPTPVAAAFLVVSVAIGARLSSPVLELCAVAVGVLLMPSSVPYPKAGIGRWPWVVAVPIAVVVLTLHAQP